MERSGAAATSDPARPVRICFVCTGNICRSPIADVVLRHVAGATPLSDGSALADRLEISSAGTSPWHEGEPMDPRARAVLEAHGYADHGHVASRFELAWLSGAARPGAQDLVVALARRHRQILLGLARTHGDLDDRVVLLRSFDRQSGGSVDVPDPYYGDEAAFEECLAMVEAGCRGLATALVAIVEAGPAGPDPAGPADRLAGQSKLTNASPS